MEKKRNIIKEWEYFKSDETYGKIPGCSGNKYLAKRYRA